MNIHIPLSANTLPLWHAMCFIAFWVTNVGMGLISFEVIVRLIREPMNLVPWQRETTKPWTYVKYVVDTVGLVCLIGAAAWVVFGMLVLTLIMIGA